MLFKPDLLDKLLNKEKTQTRRLFKSGETCDWLMGEIIAVHDRNGRIKWKARQIYAACPGRGKVRQAEFKLLKIRREDVRNISHEDAIAEGFKSRFAFWDLWIRMHDKTAAQNVPQGYDELMARPAEYYDAWALTFEIVARESAGG